MVDRAAGESKREVLERVLAVARQLSASADLVEILGVIIDAMRDLLEADRATVFEYDPATHELFSTVAHGLAGDHGDEGEIRFSADRGLAGDSARNRTIINIPDAHADERFNADIDRQTGYRTRSLLTIPLLATMANSSASRRCSTRAGAILSPPMTRRWPPRSPRRRRSQ